jgi:hypothetical protein
MNRNSWQEVRGAEEPGDGGPFRRGEEGADRQAGEPHQHRKAAATWTLSLLSFLGILLY